MAVESASTSHNQIVVEHQYEQTAASHCNKSEGKWLEPAVLQKKFNALTERPRTRHAQPVDSHKEEVTASVLKAYTKAIEIHTNPQAAKEAYAKLFSCFLQLHSLLCRNGHDVLGYELNQDGLSLLLKDGKEQFCFFEVTGTRLPEGTLAGLAEMDIVHRYIEYKCPKISADSASKARYQNTIEQHFEDLKASCAVEGSDAAEDSVNLPAYLALVSELPIKLRQAVGISVSGTSCERQLTVTFSDIAIAQIPFRAREEEDVTDPIIAEQFILFCLQSDKDCTALSIRSFLDSVKSAASLKDKMTLWDNMKMKLPENRRDIMSIKLAGNIPDFMECHFMFNHYDFEELKFGFFPFRKHDITETLLLSEPYLEYLQATSADLTDEQRKSNTQAVTRDIQMMLRQIAQATATATADDIEVCYKQLKELHIKAGRECLYKVLEDIFVWAETKLNTAREQARKRKLPKRS